MPSTPLLRISLLAALLSGSPTIAQTEPANPDSDVRFQLDDQGRVCIYPDPFTQTDRFAPMLDPLQGGAMGVGMSLSTIGILGLLLNGNTDLVSMTDADRFFARLGGGDAALLQALQPSRDDNPPAWHALRRQIAIDACAARGFRPALGLLQQITADASAGPDVRDAARRAITALGGEAPDRPTPTQARLAQVLAESPADCSSHIVFDRNRLPRSDAVCRLAREASLAMYGSMTEPQGDLSVYEDAAFQRLAETPGTIGYELARRFGNHHIYRVTLALKLPENFPMQAPSAWIALEGRYDLAALRRGLDADDISYQASDDTVQLTQPGGPEIVIRADRATLTTGIDAAFEALGAEAAAEVAATLPDAPVAIHVGAFQMADAPQVNALLPRTVGLILPTGTATEVRLEARMPTADAARAIAGQITGWMRMLEQQIDDEQLPASLAPVVEGCVVQQDGTAIRVSLDTAGLDLERVLRALILG